MKVKNYVDFDEGVTNFIQVKEQWFTNKVYLCYRDGKLTEDSIMSEEDAVEHFK